MTSEQPTTTLQPEFSGADAVATPWATVREELARAEIAWLTTVRPDGRPHVTPLLFIWQDGALYFCTGAEERKARNLAQNAHCVLTTGCNALNEGRDLVVEGDAVPVCDTAILQRLGRALRSEVRLALHRARWRVPWRRGEYRPGVRGVPADGVRLRQGRPVQPDALSLLTPRWCLIL